MSNEPAEIAARLALRALEGAPKLLPESIDRPPFFYHACIALTVAERYDEALPAIRGSSGRRPPANLPPSRPRALVLPRLRAPPDWQPRRRRGRRTRRAGDGSSPSRLSRRRGPGCAARDASRARRARDRRGGRWSLPARRSIPDDDPRPAGCWRREAGSTSPSSGPPQPWTTSSPSVTFSSACAARARAPAPWRSDAALAQLALGAGDRGKSARSRRGRARQGLRRPPRARDRTTRRGPQRGGQQRDRTAAPGDRHTRGFRGETGARPRTGRPWGGPPARRTASREPRESRGPRSTSPTAAARSR